MVVVFFSFFLLLQVESLFSETETLIWKEDFETASVGEKPVNWFLWSRDTESSPVIVDNIAACSSKRSLKIKEGSSIRQVLPAPGHGCLSKGVCTFHFYPTTTTCENTFIVKKWGKIAVQLVWKNGFLYYHDGRKLAKVSPFEEKCWYMVKIIARAGIPKGSFELYLSKPNDSCLPGEPTLRGRFKDRMANFNEVSFESKRGDFFVDEACFFSLSEIASAPYSFSLEQQKEDKYTLCFQNLLNKETSLTLNYTITDEILTPLAKEHSVLRIPALQKTKVSLTLPKTRYNNCRILLSLKDSQGNLYEEREKIELNSLRGARNKFSLNGTWDMLRWDKDSFALPLNGEWEKVSVPMYTQSTGLSRPNISLDTHRVWYRKRFILPSEMEGKRIKISFGAVYYQAEVYLNGSKIGSHFGGFTPFSVDATKEAKIGEENELLVAVTDWTAACLKKLTEEEERISSKHTIERLWDSVIAPVGPAGLISYARIPPSIWQSVQLISHSGVYVEDIFVIPSVQNEEITLNIKLKNEEGSERKVKVKNVIEDKRGTAFTFEDKEINVPANSSISLTLKEPWSSPVLWYPYNPHLYRLVTTLHTGNTVEDSKTTRFGFREVWTDREHVVFNGVKIHLFGLWQHSKRYKGSYSYAFSYLSRLKKRNCTLMRMHQYPWKPFWPEVADELGFLLIEESPYGWAGELLVDALENPIFWDNYRKDLEGMVKRDRNSPSVIIWSLENEVLQFLDGLMKKEDVKLAKRYTKRARIAEKEFAESGNFVRKLDPTRLILHEADGDPEGKADIIGVHYPRSWKHAYGQYYPNSLYEDQGSITWQKWFLGRYRGDWKKDKPLYIGEYTGVSVTPLWDTALMGDKALATEDYGHTLAEREVFDYSSQFEIEAYRWLGVGMAAEPLTLLGENTTATAEKFSPVAVFVKEYDCCFFEQRKIPRTLIVYNDSWWKGKFSLVWRTELMGKEFEKGEIALISEPGSKKVCNIKLNTPSVKERTSFVLSLSLYKDKKLQFTTKKDYSVFPEIDLKNLSLIGVGLYDPAGNTRKMFDSLGIKHRKIKELKNIDNISTLVIGRDAFSVNREVEETKKILEKFVRNGGKVICFQQGRTSYYDWLPVEIGTDQKYKSTISFKRAIGHPVFSGIHDEDLRFWRKDNFVSRNDFFKPKRGNFRVLIDSGGRKGLAWTSLLEVPYEKGFYLLSQLELTDKVEICPPAAMLFKNMLVYAQNHSPHWSRVGLLVKQDSKTDKFFSSLGVKGDNLVGKVGQKDLFSYNLLIVAGGKEIWEEVKENEERLRTFVKEGGKVILRRINRRSLPIAKSLCRIDLNVKKAEKGSFYKVKEDPLLSGISNTELYWQKSFPMEYSLMTKGCKKVEVLTQPAGLVKISSEKGYFLLDQIRWEEEKKYEEYCSRILCGLLTNLGVKLGSPSRNPSSRRDFFHVDISTVCNKGFKGMLDPGKDDLWLYERDISYFESAYDIRTIPLKMQNFNGVCFDIIEPTKNRRKSCVVLKSSLRPYFPEKVVEIPVGKKGKVLYFLHTAGWRERQDAVIAKYLVHYNDGHIEEIPIRYGKEINSWHSSETALPEAKIAWKGKDGLALYNFAWKNPYPDKIISFLDFVSEKKNAVPILVAITGER